jgi:hypothetical protein
VVAASAAALILASCRRRRAEFKVLVPADWNAFLKTHTEFVREWDKMTGLR